VKLLESSDHCHLIIAHSRNGAKYFFGQDIFRIFIPETVAEGDLHKAGKHFCQLCGRARTRARAFYEGICPALEPLLSTETPKISLSFQRQTCARVIHGKHSDNCQSKCSLPQGFPWHSAGTDWQYFRNFPENSKKLLTALPYSTITCQFYQELDRLLNYPIVPMPMVPIMKTANGECYRLSIEMPCL